jgi:hypothetical protein
MLFPAKVNFADDRLSERNAPRQVFLHGTCQQMISLSSDQCHGVGKGPPAFPVPRRFEITQLAALTQDKKTKNQIHGGKVVKMKC